MCASNASSRGMAMPTARRCGAFVVVTRDTWLLIVLTHKANVEVVATGKRIVGSFKAGEHTGAKSRSDEREQARCTRRGR